jgi:hypothetical protein
MNVFLYVLFHKTYGKYSLVKIPILTIKTYGQDTYLGISLIGFNFKIGERNPSIKFFAISYRGPPTLPTASCGREGAPGPIHWAIATSALRRT